MAVVLTLFCLTGGAKQIELQSPHIKKHIVLVVPGISYIQEPSIADRFPFWNKNRGFEGKKIAWHEQISYGSST